MGPITQKDMAHAQCGNPGCSTPGACQIWLHGRCHPSAPNRSVYDKASGTLLVLCAECEAPIAAFLVARSDKEAALTFELDAAEIGAFEAWRKEHERTCPPVQASGDYTWEFSVAGDTSVVKVRCACGQSLDLTHTGA